MSKTIFEDENISLTRFCGPNGTMAYQVTTKRGELKIHKTQPEYISVLMEFD